MHEAVALATVDGLEGLSIGNLAHALDMSKSGIYAHFGSKQDLQLATVRRGGAAFQAEVIDPALGGAARARSAGRRVRRLLRPPRPADLPRRLLLRRRGPRDGHPTRSREGAESPRSRTGSPRSIRQFAVAAVERGELPADEDPDAVTFELSGLRPRRQRQLRPPPGPRRARPGQADRPPPPGRALTGAVTRPGRRWCRAPARTAGRSRWPARRPRLSTILGIDRPSISSRMMSAWPAWRAISSI